MHRFTLGALLCHGLATFVAAHAAAKIPTLTTHAAPDLVKRAPGAGPSQYPYGNPLTGEMSYENWDPKKDDQKARAVKLHNNFGDMIQLAWCAWDEADRNTESFKRWFDEGDRDNVKKVMEKIVGPTTFEPTTLVKDWVCQQEDGGLCTGGKNAWSASNRGHWHMCPPGLAQPNTKDLKCSDLDGYASKKIKSIGFSMFHEITHWNKVGDAALGQHITDKANGASDCFGLSGPDKLLNAQNYAYLGAEGFYKRKQCTFTNPPPGTTASTGDIDSDVEDDPSEEGDPPAEDPPEENPPDEPAPPYAPGECHLHLKQTELPCFADSKDYVGFAELWDNDKQKIGGTVGADKPMNNDEPYDFSSKLHNKLIITGEHREDYVQFRVGGLHWTSGDTEGDSHCKVEDWSDSSTSCTRFGTRAIHREMDCYFPCDGKL